MGVSLRIIEEHTNEQFLNNGGISPYDKEAIITHCAKVAGECYDQDGWGKLSIESPEKTKRRESLTLGVVDGSGYGNEHATPYEHIMIGLEICGPKFLMMLLNNERQCVTSEKSARYTSFTPENGISSLELELYAVWVPVFEVLINDKYGHEKYFSPTRISKLAQENARYLTSVFTQTQMIHTVPWIQLNRVAGFMRDFINDQPKNDFYARVVTACKDFLDALDALNVLDERAMSNRKGRKLSLFGDRLVSHHFGDVYSTYYMGSFAQLAQAHRHRTINYSMILPSEFECYVPPILYSDPELVEHWRKDMKAVAHNYPQGMLVHINECGTSETFDLKCQERLCTAAQLEIMHRTAKTYKLAYGIRPKSRCVKFGYPCASPCGFADGVNGTRKI